MRAIYYQLIEARRNICDPSSAAPIEEHRKGGGGANLEMYLKYKDVIKSALFCIINQETEKVKILGKVGIPISIENLRDPNSQVFLPIPFMTDLNNGGGCQGFEEWRKSGSFKEIYRSEKKEIVEIPKPIEPF